MLKSKELTLPDFVTVKVYPDDRYSNAADGDAIAFEFVDNRPNAKYKRTVFWVWARRYARGIWPPVLIQKWERHIRIFDR